MININNVFEKKNGNHPRVVNAVVMASFLVRNGGLALFYFYFSFICLDPIKNF
jgi:hypothetical protein